MTMEAVNEIQERSQLTADDWRGGLPAIRRKALLRDREGAKLSHPTAFADYGADLFNVVGVSETSGRGRESRLLYIENVCTVFDLCKVGNFEGQHGRNRSAGD